MKPKVISADALFEDHREHLGWQWLAGQSRRQLERLAQAQDIPLHTLP